MNLAPFVASPMTSVRQMLTLSDVQADDVVYDLGSGDGRIVIAAVRDFNAKRAVGIEQTHKLVTFARSTIRDLRLEHRVDIVHADFLTVDVNDADVILFYLTTYGADWIRSKLEKEVKPGARVVSRHYPILAWTPSKVHENIYLYRRQRPQRLPATGNNREPPPLSII
jgi:precorrin-6B methylase 2